MKRYKRQKAEWLNEYIDNLSDPGEEVEPTEKQIINTLYQAAQDITPSPVFVDNLSARLQASAREISARRAAGGWSFFNRLSRLLGAGVAGIASILLLLWMASFLPGTAGFEPTAPEREGEDKVISATETLLTYPEAPAELPLQHINLVAVPTSPDEAVTWALQFGLVEPKAFLDPRDVSTIYVLGQDGRQLTFRSTQSGLVDYSDTTVAEVDGALLSFSQAGAAAVAFLDAHGLLPDTYQVSEPPEENQRASVRQIIVTPEVDGYPFSIGTFAPTARLWVGPDGRITRASWGTATITPGESVSIKPAQQVYEGFLKGEEMPVRTETYPISRPETEVRYYTPPPPVYEIGEVVDVKGWPEFLIAADGTEVRATLSTMIGQYLLVGPEADRLAEAATDPEAAVRYSEVLVQGKILSIEGQGRWLLEVTRWQEGPPPLSSVPPLQCSTGTIHLEGGEVWFWAEGGTPEGGRYHLPDAPEELSQDERVQVCAESFPADRQSVIWLQITTPPPTETAGVSEGGVTVVSEVRSTNVVTAAETTTAVVGHPAGTSNAAEQAAPESAPATQAETADTLRSHQAEMEAQLEAITRDRQQQGWPEAGNADSFIVERIELTYHYEIQLFNSGINSDGAPPSWQPEQVARPTWLFYGRNTDNTMYFVVYLPATED